VSDRSSSFAAPAGFRASPTRALPPGEVVASTYAIGDEVARADDGCVFEARDMRLDRTVALKLGWRDAGTPSLVGEAKRCAAVVGPCAVEIHGMGAHNGVEFVVGERVHGALIGNTLTPPLALDRYLARLHAIAVSVARAHDAGIAIGSLRGNTVLCVPGLLPASPERLVLGRLSLSQVPALGPHGEVFAPEISRGEVSAADPSAAEAIDLYALGSIALELASGHAPFASNDAAAEARGHAELVPPRLAELRPDFPHELSDLCEWLLAKHPVARPRSAADVASQIAAVIERNRAVVRTLRVLIVDQDTARLRWIGNLARRAASTITVEIASDGNDAIHKLGRDLPDVVIVDTGLGGAMNALELCMYARGLDRARRPAFVLIGDVSSTDRALLGETEIAILARDYRLPDALLDTLRTATRAPSRRRGSRNSVAG